MARLFPPFCMSLMKFDSHTQGPPTNARGCQILEKHHSAKASPRPSLEQRSGARQRTIRGSPALDLWRGDHLSAAIFVSCSQEALAMRRAVQPLPSAAQQRSAEGERNRAEPTTPRVYRQWHLRLRASRPASLLWDYLGPQTLTSPSRRDTQPVCCHVSSGQRGRASEVPQQPLR